MGWLGFALRDIAANRLRYAVLAVSMLIGMLSAVAVAISGGTVVDALVAQEELQYGREGSYALSVSDAGALTRTSFGGSGTQFEAASRSIQEVGESDGLAVGFLLEGKAAVIGTAGPSAAPEPRVQMRWLDGAFSDFYRFPVVEGGEPRAHGVLPPEIDLNERAASEFGLSVDDSVSIDPDVAPGEGGVCPATGIEVRVAGIVADGKTEAYLYGSLPTLEALCPDAVANQAVELRWVTTSHAGEAERLFRETLDRHSLPYDPSVRRADTVAGVADQIRLVNLMFAVTGGLMLTVTIVAIANVGLSTVRERSTELSIRQAFGATPWQIVAQVLGGSLAVGVCVAVLGVAATLAGVYWLLPQLIPAASAIGAPAFPWGGCFAAIGAALGAAVGGGLLPAWVALRLPVAVILRR